jgi:hypothetical protein
MMLTDSTVVPSSRERAPSHASAATRGRGLARYLAPLAFAAVMPALAGCTVETVKAPALEPASADGDAGADAPPPPETIQDRLTRFLHGRFDSVEQSKKDKEYLAIQLLTCRVDVPALGQHVLYVEQAMLESVSSPYRQRLYVIEAREPAATRVVSRVFEFKRPASVRGLCAKPEPVAIDAADVEERAGCNVELEWNGESFVGGTVGKNCSSTRPGTAYVTSVVTVHENELESWDRGWDASDQQAWGAVSGGYHFVRRAN